MSAYNSGGRGTIHQEKGSKTMTPGMGIPRESVPSAPVQSDLERKVDRMEKRIAALEEQVTKLQGNVQFLESRMNSSASLGGIGGIN